MEVGVRMVSLARGSCRRARRRWYVAACGLARADPSPVAPDFRRAVRPSYRLAPDALARPVLVAATSAPLPSAQLCLALWFKIVRSAFLPEHRETGIANAVILQRKYFDLVAQGPPILLGPTAAQNAFVFGDRLHCHRPSIDAENHWRSRV